ncbi:hypothetical protein [Vibrio splendidus]|uniref:hypothetical protein n=1 Tax=Vibrio splendidus TaxID=29497 RepID=UPI000D3874E4|nr:hypothetical protein [Vibrio splendidus]PTP86943.1 hypothetical protein CWO03_12695 [Vibrio splendidus]
MTNQKKHTNELKTAKQWLALKQEEKRYPRHCEIGKVCKRGTYYHYDQTIPVRSEATHHLLAGFVPVNEQYKGITYYYFDECEPKKTPRQWREEGRRVIPNSVPCHKTRNGFNPVNRESFEISYFLRSDTVRI